MKTDLTRKKYAPWERARYGAAYRRLLNIIISCPGASSAAEELEEFRRGLEKALAAGFPIDWPDKDGETLTGLTCLEYVWHGGQEYLTVINALLAAGARPELDEEWNNGWRWPSPDQRTRRDWLAAYIGEWAAHSRAEDAAPGFDYAL